MTHAWVKLLSIASALGLASCADVPRKPTPITRTAPLVSPPQRVSQEKPAAPPIKQGKVTRISLGDFFQLQQSGKALIIDARPAFYYRMGHVPGALNWPRSQFNAKLASFEPKITAAAAAGLPVMLYCTDLACPDALHVATQLAARGHSTTILQGGWEAWKTGELPIE